MGARSHRTAAVAALASLDGGFQGQAPGSLWKSRFLSLLGLCVPSPLSWQAQITGVTLGSRAAETLGQGLLKEGFGVTGIVGKEWSGCGAAQAACVGLSQGGV